MIDLIAEIGWNHMGDMDLAKNMVRAAREVGATYSKFQSWAVKRLAKGPWDNDGRRQIYEKAELSAEDHMELSSFCDKVGIRFLTTCFSVEDLDFIRTVTSEVKIASTECKNLNLVTKAIRDFDTVFISVGASRKSEWLEWAKCDNVRLMHCVSAYPCEAEHVNLPKLKEVLKACPCGGYSGHCDGIWDAVAAISMGAQVVEKHFTLDRGLPGKDNKFALQPAQFEDIFRFAEAYKLMSEDHGVDYQDIEEEARRVYAGRWG